MLRLRNTSTGETCGPLVPATRSRESSPGEEFGCGALSWADPDQKALNTGCCCRPGHVVVGEAAMAKQQLDGTSRGLERSPASGEQALTPVDEAGGSDELGGGVVGLIVVGTLLLAALLAFRLYRMTQWWASRARSAKVLDEIEMEFVNDMDMDEELLRNTLPRRAPRARRKAHQPWACGVVGSAISPRDAPPLIVLPRGRPRLPPMPAASCHCYPPCAALSADATLIGLPSTGLPSAPHSPARPSHRPLICTRPPFHSDLAPRQREASGDWVSIDPSTPSVSR